MYSIFSAPCVKCEILKGETHDTYRDDDGREACPKCGYTRPFSTAKYTEEIEAFKAEAAKAASE